MGFPNSGAMLRAPMDTKQIQVAAAGIYCARPGGDRPSSRLLNTLQKNGKSCSRAGPGLVGSSVKVTLKIEAEVEAGTPENVVRTVTENSRTRNNDGGSTHTMT